MQLSTENRTSPTRSSKSRNAISRFFFRYQHKFFGNIYSKEELASSTIKTLKDYYVVFEKFIKICISLHSVLISHIDLDDDINDDILPELFENHCADCDDIDDI